MLNKEEHLLVIFSEELTEVQQNITKVQQAITKALRFGLQDGYPGKETTNAQDIMIEFHEVEAVLKLLVANGSLEAPNNPEALREAKIKRIARYMEYAREKESLEEETDKPKWDSSQDIKPSDLKIDSYSSVRQSGFALNPYNGIRILHIPTGIMAVCEDERSQHKNKAKAFEMLKAKLKAYSNDD